MRRFGSREAVEHSHERGALRDDGGFNLGRRSFLTGFKNRIHQRIGVARFGAMIHERGADRELAADGGRGRRHAALLVQIGHDLRIDAVGVIATKAETDDVELRGCEKFELRFGADAGFEMARQHAALFDHAAQLMRAVSLEREPRLESAKAA